MAAYQVYGIKNCTTVKNALAQLDASGANYEFTDFKKAGVDESLLRDWIAQAGLAKILNKNSLTWRRLSPDEQASADTLDGAVALMTAKPNLIKRPILQYTDGLIVGFDKAAYQQLV